jgi:hypothetical protein
MLYDGTGRDGKPFLMGLVDVQTLKCAYDGKKEHRKSNLEHPSSPHGVLIEHGSSEPKCSSNPVSKATSRDLPKKNGKTASWDDSGSTQSYLSPLAAAAVT